MTTTTNNPTDRKTTVSILDDAARQSYTIGRDAATSKQCWFLGGLLCERGFGAFEVLEGRPLTKSRASRLIDEMLNLPRDAWRDAA